MATATVEEGQNMLDMAIQHTGDQSGIFDFALANNCSITGMLQPGAKMVVPDLVNNAVAKLFFDKQYIPATDDTAAEFNMPKGIGTMIIGVDFKIG